MTATDAGLQELPLYNLNDKSVILSMAHAHIKLTSTQISIFYDMIPNPAKSDETDPDLLLTFPQSHYYTISKRRSLPKNISLLEDMLYSTKKGQISLHLQKLN